jgi:gliding motility-associated protein GldL
MNFANSKFYQAIMPYLYGWGAALVILGALFKINHYDYANEMLLVGMSVEALIFFMSAFEKAPKKYKWERAYPGILDAEESDDTGTVTQQLGEMLENVDVDSKVIKELGDGMKKLSKSASGLGEFADGTKKYNSLITFESTSTFSSISPNCCVTVPVSSDSSASRMPGYALSHLYFFGAFSKADIKNIRASTDIPTRSISLA